MTTPTREALSMALPDLTNVTLDERRTLVVMLSQQIQAAEQAEADKELSLRSEIGAAVSTLTDLLGPVDATKPTMANLLAGNVSIREVAAFSPTELATQPGLALWLLFKAVEASVATQIAQAQVQSRAL